MFSWNDWRLGLVAQKIGAVQRGSAIRTEGGMCGWIENRIPDRIEGDVVQRIRGVSLNLRHEP